MTIRSEGQFNTVVYEDEDIYRGIDRRDVILLHPDDLAACGLSDGDRVTIHGPAGRCTASAPPSSPKSNPATPRCTTPSATSSSAAPRPAKQNAGVQVRDRATLKPEATDPHQLPFARR